MIPRPQPNRMTTPTLLVQPAMTPASPSVAFDILELCIEIAHHISDLDDALVFRSLTRNTLEAAKSSKACRTLTLLEAASQEMAIQFSMENERVPFLLPSTLRRHPLPLQGTIVTIIRLHPAVTAIDQSFKTMVRLQVTSRGLLAPGIYQEMFLVQPPQAEIRAQVFIARAITKHDDMRVTSFRVTIRRPQGIRLCDMAIRVNPLARLWAMHDEPLAISWFATKSLTQTSPVFLRGMSNSFKVIRGQSDFETF